MSYQDTHLLEDRRPQEAAPKAQPTTNAPPHAVSRIPSQVIIAKEPSQAIEPNTAIMFMTDSPSGGATLHVTSRDGVCQVPGT